ncbi:unnamed protein product [Brachionus calyciflorus]|uniref:Uncharacterized protein n=1 Tax=Brachionus calyciflorus TaxID=104777 RepID=A0A813RAK5_9BILA|nr:unnamed protein product [Brachionus calyciflorus]
MEINTQSITNSLDYLNKFCIDWNHLGCIAFASSNNINIVDSNTMKVVKTLTITRSAPICKLKWSMANLNSNYNIYPYLASASDDIISIWDVNESKMTMELFPNESNNLSIPNNKIIDMKWLATGPSLTKNNNSNTLIALYSNSKLIIWNTQNSTKTWTKTFNDQKLISFTIDPHDFLKLAFLGSNFLYFLKLENLNDSNMIEKSQRKFYLASNDSSTLTETSLDSKKSSTVNIFTSYWNIMKQSDSKSSQTSTQQKQLLKECFQIEYHSFVRNLIFLVYPREIFIFDLTVNQTISFVQADKIFSPFLQIYSCSQADVFYALHENGSVSVHSRSESGLFQYNLVAYSDQKRLAKNSNVFGLTVCPNTERFFSVLLSDGRVLKYELFNKKSRRNNLEKEFLFLYEFISNKCNLKLMLTSMLDSVPSSSFVIKMGPRLTRKNCKFWQPLLAIGDTSGFLSIFNLNKNQVVRKLTLTTYPIIGIEWVNLHSIICWSQNTNTIISSQDNLSGSQNKQVLVKNEILYTDLRTGEFVNFRPGTREESPIISVKISYLRQYLVILFKEHPLEIWDLKNFSLIKKISKKSPIISILEWCPHDFNKKIDTKPALESKNVQIDSALPIDVTDPIKTSDKEIHISEQKESFICIDTTNLMYSFSVECNHIKDGAIQLPEDGYLVNITCVDLKKDLVLFGDMDGGLSRWNIKTKNLKTIHQKRGLEIKKVKFAPGKENMLLLVQFNETLHIIDVTNLYIFSEFKSKVKILDSYWCSSDKVLVYFSDLSIRVYDVNFTQAAEIGPNLFKSSQETNLFKIKSNMFEKLKKNKQLNEFEKDENDNFKILINKLNLDLKDKIDQYASLSAFLNLNSFETRFWCLFSYLLDKNENLPMRKFRLLLKHNSMLLNSKEYRASEIELMNFYKEKLETNQQLIYILKDFLLSNQLDAAFNFLMDTESTSDAFTNNLTKACLISSLKNSNENSQTKTSIKLVATNLIANGKIYDGVELLCMIGLVFDACRYLQDNNEWEKAAWLAKIRLNEDEQNDVINRWCEFLCSNQINRKEMAILLYLSCKSYWKALGLLADTNYIQLTYLFFEFLLQHNLIDLGQEVKVSSTQQVNESLLNNKLDLIQNQHHREITKKILNNYADFKKLLNF